MHSAATPSPFAKQNTLKGATNDEQLSIFTKEEATGVMTFAPSVDLNEFNFVCALHLGPGPCGTLFLLPSPPSRDKVCMVLGSKVRGQNTKCLRGVASGMIDRENKTSRSSNLMHQPSGKKPFYGRMYCRLPSILQGSLCKTSSSQGTN